jgi:hypothetical protein
MPKLRVRRNIDHGRAPEIVPTMDWTPNTQPHRTREGTPVAGLTSSGLRRCSVRMANDWPTCDQWPLRPGKAALADLRRMRVS